MHAERIGLRHTFWSREGAEKPLHLTARTPAKRIAPPRPPLKLEAESHQEQEKGKKTALYHADFLLPTTNVPVIYTMFLLTVNDFCRMADYFLLRWLAKRGSQQRGETGGWRREIASSESLATFGTQATASADHGPRSGPAMEGPRADVFESPRLPCQQVGQALPDLPPWHRT